MPFIALGVLHWNIRETRSTLCFMSSDSRLFSTSFMTHGFDEESKVFAFRYVMVSWINIVLSVLFFSLSFTSNNNDDYFFYLNFFCNFSKQQNGKGLKKNFQCYSCDNHDNDQLLSLIELIQALKSSSQKQAFCFISRGDSDLNVIMPAASTSFIIPATIIITSSAPSEHLVICHTGDNNLLQPKKTKCVVLQTPFNHTPCCHILSLHTQRTNELGIMAYLRT